MKQGLVRLLFNFGKRFMGWTLHMIMCVLLCYPVSIRIYYQQGVLFLVKSQIQKGANPEKAARQGYEKTCDYLDILNKRNLIQQRALACQGKALAHNLQRELYTMGNSILIRRETEMIHLQRHLGDSSHQELWSSLFWSTPCSGLN